MMKSDELVMVMVVAVVVAVVVVVLLLLPLLPLLLLLLDTGPTRRPDRFIDSCSWRGWFGGVG